MIEKEYIDLEEAVATLKRNSLKCFNSYYKGYVNAIKDLTNIPAADVSPVRHGRWIETAHKGYKCSLCNCLSSLFDENLKSEFCPWCGARMDGEEK